MTAPPTFRLLACLALLALPHAANAQAPAADPAQPPSTFGLRDGTVDLAVPESPAFTALGLTPEQVSRPTTPRELATSVLNGIDRNGNFQTGVAIDTAPYMLLAGSRITLADYQKKDQFVTRFLARWQVSFASTKGSGSNDPSAKLALGMRFTVFDQGDPRMDADLIRCLADAGNVMVKMNPIPPFLSDEEKQTALRQREELVRASAKPCREAAAKRRWNRSAWIAGVAPTWTSPDGSTSQIDYSGTAVWTSLGYGFERVPVLEDRAMVAFYLKARTREIAPDVFSQGAFVTQDNVTTGFRFLTGSPSSQFNVEMLWLDNDRPDGREDRYWNLAVGFEQRLVDNTWLNLTFGRQLARDAEGQLSVVGAFNWGLGARP